jgi:hypothetical protein
VDEDFMAMLDEFKKVLGEELSEEHVYQLKRLISFDPPALIIRFVSLIDIALWVIAKSIKPSFTSSTGRRHSLYATRHYTLPP